MWGDPEDEKQPGLEGRAPFALTVVLKEFQEEEPPAYFVAECVELSGCVAEGDTPEDARRSIDEPASFRHHALDTQSQRGSPRHTEGTGGGCRI